MEDSDKLEISGPERYTLMQHRKYLDGALEALGITRDATMVFHDWVRRLVLTGPTDTENR
jgi:haloalkane dehalogenase